MRTLAIASFFLIIARSEASFDLMLLGDNTTSGAQRVLRYDPINRVTLGSFGTGFINDTIVDVACDQSTQTAWVMLENGGVRRFNYNTGDYLGGFVISSLYNQLQFDPASNRLYVSAGNGSSVSPGRAINLTTGASLAPTGGSPMAAFAGTRPGTSLISGFSFNTATSVVQMASFSSSLGTAVNVVQTTEDASSDQGMMDAVFASDGTMFGIKEQGANLRLMSATVNTSGAFGTLLARDTFGFAPANPARLAMGHGNLMYVLSNNVLSTYDTALFDTLGSQTLSFVGSANVRGMAVVVAPEPATLAAVTFGLVPFLRSKRRRK